MREGLEKLIQKYQERADKQLQWITLLETKPTLSSKEEQELHTANLIRIFWNTVAQDLRKITDKK